MEKKAAEERGKLDASKGGAAAPAPAPAGKAPAGK
jgi:hypothetical protein